MHWQPHLEQTRAAILQGAQRAPRRRKALLFGAGLLHDIPLRELSALFDEVLLADIVHTWPCRLAAARFGNVRLVEMDVTGVVGDLARARTSSRRILPASLPQRFLADEDLDFTASVNLLSQLSWAPGHFLSSVRSEAELQGLKAQLISAHLAYLEKLPGHTTLVTDTTWRARPVEVQRKAGEYSSGASLSEADTEIQSWDVLGGVALPEPDLAWDWEIAPAPERSSDTDFIARVHAYWDWKGSARLRSGVSPR